MNNTGGLAYKDQAAAERALVAEKNARRDFVEKLKELNKGIDSQLLREAIKFEEWLLEP